MISYTSPEYVESVDVSKFGFIITLVQYSSENDPIINWRKS